MTALVSAFVATLVLQLAWTGALVDLGPESAAWIAVALLAGSGWGLSTRQRGPSWIEGLVLAVGLPLRGPLHDVIALALPVGDATLVGSCALTLVPLGVLVGRQVARASRGRVATLVAGLCCGEALVAAGALAWTPAVVAGPVAAAILAAMQRGAAAAAPDEDPVPRLAGVPMGFALMTSVLVLQRVAAAYQAPGLNPMTESVLLVLLPAVFVAAPVMILASSGWMRRLFVVTSAAGLAWALQASVDSLVVYTNPAMHVSVSRRLHTMALRFPLVDESWLWLLSFGGWISVAVGAQLGALRTRAAGPLMIGAAAAVAVVQLVIDAGPVRLTEWPHEIEFAGPVTLLLIGAGAAWISAATALLGRAGWLAAPLLVVPLVLVPPELHASFEDVRRIGEPSVDAAQRQTLADVLVFSAFGAHQLSSEGVVRYHDTFTGTRYPWDPADLLRDPEDRTQAPPPDDEVEPDMSIPARRRRFGLRIGGVALHADHPPVGAEGAASRLVRLFAPPGPTLLLGIGSELLAGDLAAADGNRRLQVATSVPLGVFPFMVLEEALGQEGFEDRVSDRPLADLAGGEAQWSAVIVAPGRPEWPATDALLARETLERVAMGLGHGGRALVWIDTTRLSERALRSRLAAFGDVFGERSFALVEQRGLEAPFVLMVGWRDEAAQPTAAGLLDRLPMPDVTGERTRLHGLDDLAGMLVRDGPGMEALADDALVHRRARPVPTSWFARGGWEAVAAVVDRGARLERVLADAPPTPARWPAGLLEGLAFHGTYDYDLYRLRTQVVETVSDVDWEAFDREWIHYAEAAKNDPDHPLLAQAVRALLEPLAVEQDYTRFATVFEAVGADRMSSWRLAAAEAAVRLATLQPDAGRVAAARAVTLRGPSGE